MGSQTTDASSAVADHAPATGGEAPGALAGRLNPRRSAFFFDVDGTLLEIERRPEDVRADPELLRIMSALIERAGGAVAFVSGRSIADIDRIFAPLTLPTAGLHGAEIRFPDGRRFLAGATLMERARPDVARFVAASPGLLLEDKGATLAVHFREAPELGPTVRTFLERFAPDDDIAVQEGKMVAELKPAQFDKGSAIAKLSDVAPFAARIPVFFGDDLTDESGFAFVNKSGGHSVHIGSDAAPTDARYRLSRVADLRRFLENLLEDFRENP